MDSVTCRRVPADERVSGPLVLRPSGPARSLRSSWREVRVPGWALMAPRVPMISACRLTNHSSSSKASGPAHRHPRWRRHSLVYHDQPLNHDTVQFFRKRDHFGLDPADLHFFPQGTLPSVDESGKILLAKPDQISANPDGSGGCFRAFKAAGLLEDLVRRGIRYLFFYGVDNALVRVCDPYFIGFAIDQGKDIASKAVLKNHPAEKGIGVYAYRNGKPSIIEYTELPDDLAEARDEAGQLRYGSANIVTHVFRTEFLVNALDEKTPYHVAHKAVEYVDQSGRTVKPSGPMPTSLKPCILTCSLMPMIWPSSMSAGRRNSPPSKISKASTPKTPPGRCSWSFARPGSAT